MTARDRRLAPNLSSSSLLRSSTIGSWRPHPSMQRSDLQGRRRHGCAATVTVTDPNGKGVTGLTYEDFTSSITVWSSRFTFFASEAVPLDVALVLDTSSSMQADLPLVQSAASGLVRRAARLRSRLPSSKIKRRGSDPESHSRPIGRQSINHRRLVDIG